MDFLSNDYSLATTRPPAPFTIPVDLCKGGKSIKRSLLHTHLALKHCKNRFEDIFAFFDATTDILNTSLYKNQNRFRNDKAFKGLKMTQKHCKALRRFPLLEFLNKFKSQLPHEEDIKSREKVYLPTQNHVKHWLAVHKVAFDLCHKIVGYCAHAAKYLEMRLQTGHFWNWAVFMLANVSRIWTLSQAMLVTLHLSYEHHVKIVSSFPCGGAQGAYDTYEFKSNALDLKQITESHEKCQMQKMLLNNDFPKIEQVALDSDHPDVEFVGEIVSRSEPDDATRKQYLKLKKSLKQLKSLDDIKAFIKEETKCRQECRKKALTKKLEQADWKELRSTIKSKMDGGNHVPELKLMLMSWIIFPCHKGDHLCEEFQALKNA